MTACLRCGGQAGELRALCDGRKRVLRAAAAQAPTREQEREEMRQRLRLVRAERTAKQRRAMGLPA